MCIDKLRHCRLVGGHCLPFTARQEDCSALADVQSASGMRPTAMRPIRRVDCCIEKHSTQSAEHQFYLCCRKVAGAWSIPYMHFCKRITAGISASVRPAMRGLKMNWVSGKRPYRNASFTYRLGTSISSASATDSS